MDIRLHVVLATNGTEYASESASYDEAGVTLKAPVIYKTRGSDKYTTMQGVVMRTIPWHQVQHADRTTGEA